MGGKLIKFGISKEGMVYTIDDFNNIKIFSF